MKPHLNFRNLNGYSPDVTPTMIHYSYASRSPDSVMMANLNVARSNHTNRRLSYAT